MLKSLKDIFKSGGQSKEPSEHQLKLAAATLMFEVIRSDGRIDKVELIYMSEILRREFKLADQEIDELCALAKESAYEATSLQGFTRQICDNWGSAKRMKMIEYLWMLAFADDKIDPHERHFVRKVAGLLYLSETQIQQSRVLAKRELGIEDF